MYTEPLDVAPSTRSLPRTTGRRHTRAASGRRSCWPRSGRDTCSAPASPSTPCIRAGPTPPGSGPRFPASAVSSGRCSGRRRKEWTRSLACGRPGCRGPERPVLPRPATAGDAQAAPHASSRRGPRGGEALATLRGAHGLVHRLISRLTGQPQRARRPPSGRVAPWSIGIGRGVRIRNRSQGGVSASRLYASAARLDREHAAGARAFELEDIARDDRRVAVRGDDALRPAGETANALPRSSSTREAGRRRSRGAREKNGAEVMPARRRLPLRDLRRGGGRRAGAQLVRCARACERQRHRPSQPAEARGLRLEQGGVEARDDEKRGPRRLGRVGDRCDRSVRAEKEDPPRVRAQDEGEREQGDVVHLAGCAGEESQRAASRPQNRASASSLPRMRLLAKCSWLMSISPRSSRRRPLSTWAARRGAATHPGRTRRGSRRAPSERRARRSGRSRQAGERRRPRAGLRTDARLRVRHAQPRRLRDPRPARAACASRVRRRPRVEAEAARRANRPCQAVPRLPRAQQLGVTPTRRANSPIRSCPESIAMDMIIQTFNKHLT